MLKEIQEDKVFLLFLLIAIIYCALAIAGGIRAYSPVPYWDMWDGYLDFFVKVRSGEWSAWWAQHNEHRIFLARVLFWIDLAWMGGSSWFLLLINYILLVLVCFIFWRTLKENCPKSYRYFSPFLIIILSSWSQNENLTWGFQSQFILAQLLPLSALYMLHTAIKRRHGGFYNFIASCFLGVLSLGTMANGVLALPLMTAYAVITRMSWRRLVTLTVLSGFGLLAYFHNYHAPEKHGSLFVALHENPLGLAEYVLVYIGGPFYLINGKGSILFAQVTGAILISVSAYRAWRSLQKVPESSLDIALLTFILYVGGSALGTAGGRMMFGVEQALSSRYMTPALMAWAALFVILAPEFVRISQLHPRRIWIPMLGLSLVLLPIQLKALQPKSAILFERDVAALALEMHIRDQTQIGQVFPSADWALSLVEVPAKENLSIFGHSLFKDIREQIGQIHGDFSVVGRSCQGHVDVIESIEDDKKFMRINGWIFDYELKTVPNSLWILSDGGKNIGYALTGYPRPDVSTAIDHRAINTGFKGYILTTAQGQTVKLFDPQSKCIVHATLPVSYFQFLSSTEPEQITVAAERVMQGNSWTGSDFQKTKFDHLKVYGSFINSDSDTGEISLRIKRGDRLLYRSGPKSGRQFLKVNNDNSSKFSLPASLEWQMLDFSNSPLPDDFLITLSDEGSGWGEWSAVALKINK